MKYLRRINESKNELYKRISSSDLAKILGKEHSQDDDEYEEDEYYDEEYDEVNGGYGLFSEDDIFDINVPFDNSSFNKIKEKFPKEGKYEFTKQFFGDAYYMLRVNMNKERSDGYRKKSCSSYVTISTVGRYITVYQIPDEYFIIVVSHDQQEYYKCDEVDGVIDFLDIYLVDGKLP